MCFRVSHFVRDVAISVSLVQPKTSQSIDQPYRMSDCSAAIGAIRVLRLTPMWQVIASGWLEPSSSGQRPLIDDRCRTARELCLDGVVSNRAR
jgi:hypothetical protein